MNIRIVIPFFVGILVLGTSAAIAQAQPGDFVLGGGFTGRTTVRSNVTWDQYTLAPGFGVFLSPHLLVEGNLRVSYWEHSGDSSLTQTWSLGAAPSLTYLITKQQVTPYLKGSVEFPWIDRIDEYPHAWRPLILGYVGLGAWFWVNRNVALEGGINLYLINPNDVIYATSQIGLRYIWSR